MVGSTIAATDDHPKSTIGTNLTVLQAPTDVPSMNVPAPFRIKVCGIRRREDVDACVVAGVDAVGINLYPPSVRYVEPDSATTLALSDHCAEAGLLRIGVFVNETAERMMSLADRLGLDGIQLHGDESWETAQRLIGEGKLVVRAIRLPTGTLSPEILTNRLESWRKLPVTLLLDADAGANFGGVGAQLDWSTLPKSEDWILAGGLTPQNIRAAILASGAVSVDVASGVESPRGVKDATRIAEFAAAARSAWQQNQPLKSR